MTTKGACDMVFFCTEKNLDKTYKNGGNLNLHPDWPITKAERTPTRQRWSKLELSRFTGIFVDYSTRWSSLPLTSPSLVPPPPLIFQQKVRKKMDLDWVSVIFMTKKKIPKSILTGTWSRFYPNERHFCLKVTNVCKIQTHCGDTYVSTFQRWLLLWLKSGMLIRELIRPWDLGRQNLLA